SDDNPRASERQASQQGDRPRRLEQRAGDRGVEKRCEGRGVDQGQDDQERRVCGEAAGEHRSGGRVIRNAKCLVLTLVALVVAGCGYEFGTTVKPGPARGLQLAVPVFPNDTFVTDLDTPCPENVRPPLLPAPGR